ncbi:MAG: hypothetical protein H6R08_739 [Proteobacteria bacterium]|nr:hypothetical protein [Pseudomonadota bacterium]
MLRSLLVSLIVALAGCATPERPPDQALLPVHVPESTWWQVDSDIGDASLAATESARDSARVAMDNWMSLVQKRTEADFIPWFTSYWTQQWLAIKVAWYKLSAKEGTDPTVKRLAAYLREQYHDRVLEPVSREIDPDMVREQATKSYIQLLSKQLQEIPQRYGVPSDQFDRRIKDIRAIALAPHPAHSASLFQIVHADPIAKLPAYVALIAQIRKEAGGAGTGPSDIRISPVAKQASEKLVVQLVTSGGASAAAAVVGGIPGVMISLGAAGFGAMEHENERPKMETLLRENLDPVLDDMWLDLVVNPATGVMAGVDHISKQIEGSLDKTVTQPVTFEPVPQGIPLPGEQPFEDEKSDDEALPDDGSADE